jgi:hypothetical protein
MKSTSELIVESIVDSFKTIEKKEQMFAAISIIVTIANVAGDNFCETIGIIESCKNELRELLLDEKNELKFSNN